MNNIRIAHICQSDDVNIGGSLSVARELVTEQRRIGIDARLIFLYGDALSQRKSQSDAINVYCSISRHLRWTQGISMLRTTLQSIDAQIIHHHDGILWPRLSTLMLRRPLVTHGHLGRPLNGLLSGANLTHRISAISTDRLIAISGWVAGSWEQGGFPRSRIRLIPNGVDSDRFRPRQEGEKLVLRTELGLPLESQLLLWVGRLHRETKGLDRLVAVAQALDPSVHLIILGDGPDRLWLNNELRRLGLKRCTLLGKVSEPAPYFAAADAFLFTSRIETFGLVLLEAVASGLPLFAFDCEGGGSELLQKLQATLVTNQDANWLAQKITARFGWENRYEAADIVRKQYSWKVVAEKTTEVYRELLH